MPLPSTTFTAAIAALVLIATPAAGQQEPLASSTPFGDWTLRCAAAVQGQPAARGCEAIQGFTGPAGQLVGTLAIGRVAGPGPLRMVLQVPIEVRTDQPARVLADPAAPADQAVVLAFRLCSAQRGACFAEQELRDEAVLRRLRARGEGQGVILFRDSQGGEARLTFSARGLGQALDALARELR